MKEEIMNCYARRYGWWAYDERISQLHQFADFKFPLTILSENSSLGKGVRRCTIYVKIHRFVVHHTG